MNNFVIILGEPNSINSEILAKSIAFKNKAIVVGNYNLLKSQLKILKINRKLKRVKNPEKIVKFSKALHVLDIPLKFNNPFSVNYKESSVYVKKCLNMGHRLCLQKRFRGMINCAINKKNLFKSKNLGVTEYLAKKNKVSKSEVMIIYNKKLSVVPLTTHVRIRDVSKSLKKNIMIQKIKTLNQYYLKYFKKRPRIGILGLNPHNFE
jgi:4-hydroxy-L-threonine phosphate dehydrogenase PdxA